MRDPLRIYLSDHLAGSKFAVDLLGILRHQNTDNELGAFADGLKHDVEQDRQTLLTLYNSLGGRRGAGLKEFMASAGEKLARFKLRSRTRRQQGTLESLEVLALGILGKRGLWKALGEIEPMEPRIQGFDYRLLAERADEQYQRVEEQRLKAARKVLPEEHQSVRSAATARHRANR